MIERYIQRSGGESLAAKLRSPSVRVILLKDQQDDDANGNTRIAKAGTFGRLSLNPGSSPDNPFTLLCDNGCWVLLSEPELLTDVREADPALDCEAASETRKEPAATSKRELNVTFSAKFRTTIRLEPGQTISDATSDIEIPETEDTPYMPHSFEVLAVEDEEGNEVEEDADG